MVEEQPKTEEMTVYTEKDGEPTPANDPRLADDEEYPGTKRMMFSQEFMIAASELRTSNFGKTFFDKVMQANLTASAKRALVVIGANYASSDMLLTNLQRGGRGMASFSNDILAAKISLELSEICIKTACSKFDVRSPVFFVLLNELGNHVKLAVIPRASGKDRERNQQGKVTIAHEDSVIQTVQAEPQIQAQPQKKKFWQ